MLDTSENSNLTLRARGLDCMVLAFSSVHDCQKSFCHWTTGQLTTRSSGSPTVDISNLHHRITQAITGYLFGLVEKNKPTWSEHRVAPDLMVVKLLQFGTSNAPEDHVKWEWKIKLFLNLPSKLLLHQQRSNLYSWVLIHINPYKSPKWLLLMFRYCQYVSHV